MLSDVKYVKVNAADISATVDQVLRQRRQIEQRDQAARPVLDDAVPNAERPAGDVS
jgi:hypothetical protein